LNKTFRHGGEDTGAELEKHASSADHGVLVQRQRRGLADLAYRMMPSWCGSTALWLFTQIFQGQSGMEAAPLPFVGDYSSRTGTAT